ncbi:MAG: sodium-dependent transporter [Bacteroidales bacterium]|nr:sodium-dependent transporter [Bacteroidales bacterium]
MAKFDFSKRDSFGSKIGVIAAAAGSAIGLGNIWKFPYITGENGGGAFLLVYLACIALIGLPIMLAEFSLGRKANRNVFGAFKKLAPNTGWYWSGVLFNTAAFTIMSYYAVVAGWIFAYIPRSISGALSGQNFNEAFSNLNSSTVEPLIWSFVVLGLTIFFIHSGIKKGIEKYTKILMPILLVLMIILMIRSVTLPGAMEGIDFLFAPNFSALTPGGVLEALGHAFFSLSLGMGVMMTYGSYIQKQENLQTTSLQVVIADTAIALMAGVIIFPAVFAYDLEPSSGPGLIFITLPGVFNAMQGGIIFQTLFFILIGIAALTSTMSLVEVVASSVTEQLGISRNKGILMIAGLMALLIIPNSLSYGAMSDVTLFGHTVFGVFDFLASNIFLPVGGLMIALFLGWFYKLKNIRSEITNEGKYRFRLAGVYNYLIKYIAPVAIVIILLYATGILSKLGWV